MELSLKLDTNIYLAPWYVLGVVYWYVESVLSTRAVILPILSPFPTVRLLRTLIERTGFDLRCNVACGGDGKLISVNDDELMLNVLRCH